MPIRIFSRYDNFFVYEYSELNLVIELRRSYLSTHAKFQKPGKGLTDCRKVTVKVPVESELGL